MSRVVERRVVSEFTCWKKSVVSTRTCTLLRSSPAAPDDSICSFTIRFSNDFGNLILSKGSSSLSLPSSSEALWSEICSFEITPFASFKISTSTPGAMVILPGKRASSGLYLRLAQYNQNEDSTRCRLGCADNQETTVRIPLRSGTAKAAGSIAGSAPWTSRYPIRSPRTRRSPMQRRAR